MCAPRPPTHFPPPVFLRIRGINEHGRRGEGVRGHLSGVFIPSVKGAISINSSQIKVRMKVRNDSVLGIKKMANTAIPISTDATLADAEKKLLVSGGEGMAKIFLFLRLD